MPRKVKPITLNPTPEFRSWFDEFRAKWAWTESEALAFLIAEAVEKNGFDADNIMHRRGTYNRNREWEDSPHNPENQPAISPSRKAGGYYEDEDDESSFAISPDLANSLDIPRWECEVCGTALEDEDSECPKCLPI